jgi:hypothetical protein
MKSINFKKELQCDFESAISRTTDALKKEGFGILTRIDFHSKMKEKLNQDMPPLVILGACNPALAFEAYSRNPDVTSLLPCNTVVRELSEGRVSVEVAKPSAMMEILGNPELVQMALEADRMLLRALESL